MSQPTPTHADFPAFFKAVWNVDPFPWQEDLLTRLATGEDPRRAFTENPHKPIRLQLDWYGQSPMYGGEGPANSEMVFARGHYEQHGRAKGTLTVDGVERAVDGHGLRDHSWGPRSWQSPAYYRWLIGQFDDERRGFYSLRYRSQRLDDMIELLAAPKAQTDCPVSAQLGCRGHDQITEARKP